MEGYEIRSLQKVMEFGKFHTHFPFEVQFPALAVIQYLHVKALGALGNHLTDPPHPDNANSLSVAIRAKHELGCPTSEFTFPHELIPFGNAPCCRHEQRKYKVSSGF